MIKRIVKVALRWCWLGDGGAVLLGNVIRGFRVGAVLLGNIVAGCHGGPVILGNLIASCQMYWNGCFQVVLGYGWWRYNIDEFD